MTIFTEGQTLKNGEKINEQFWKAYAVLSFLTISNVGYTSALSANLIMQSRPVK